jgi:hypothetical protein
VTLILGLAVAATGVFAIMQTASLSSASGDLEDARARSHRLAGRVDTLDGRLDEATDELETAKEDLGKAQTYAAACRATVGGMDRAITLIGQSGVAFLQGDVERAKSLSRQVKAELREIEDDYRVCMSQAPSADAEAL